MNNNRIRTPKRKDDNSKPPLSSTTNANNNNIIINTDEQIKIYLAEIFTLNKKIEHLTNNMATSEKNEVIQSQKALQLQNDIASTEEKSKRKIDQYAAVRDDLKEKNALLQKDSDYNDLIAYYESKIEEAQNKNISNIKMFSDAINRLMKDSYTNNKDEVWRNLIKRYEKKIEELEKTITQYEKNERRIASRQKFFEKYCYKAEDKFERLSKISKKYELKDKETIQLKEELSKFKEEYTKELNQKEKINTDLVQLKNQHMTLKKFVNQIKDNNNSDSNSNNPINNTTAKCISKDAEEEKWSVIKKMNEDNMQLLSYQQSHPISYDNKAIIILIANLKEYIEVLNLNNNNTGILNNNEAETTTNLISILNDIESYTKMLFDKLHILLLNQSYIIDIVCDLSQQIAPDANLKKKSKQTSTPTAAKCIAILKSVCNKLVHDYTPY